MATKKQTEKAPAEKAFDFTTVSVADAAEMPKSTRKREAKPNPFLAVMTESKDNDWAAKQITIPEDAVKAAKGYIRRAADTLECGARIVERSNDDDSVTLFFSARPRRAYKARAKSENSEK